MKRAPRVVIREAEQNEPAQRRSSLRTLFDARLRGRWWFVVPIAWALALGAAALTWWLVH